MNTISSTSINFSVGAAAHGEKSMPLGRETTLETREQLEKVAEKFEALFVKTILSSARSAQLSDPLLNNEGQKTFNQMLDTEYAGALAQRESLGIADALVRQFENRVLNGDVE
jgi:flagellar protein FlgJ